MRESGCHKSSPPVDRAPAWRPAQRRLHWWTALLVGVTFPLGWVMVRIPFSLLLLKFLAYQLHKTIGILVVGFVLARLVLRLRYGRPDWIDVVGWRRRAASAAHGVLYVLLLVTPVLGYLTASTAPNRIPTLFLGLIPIPSVLGPDRFWFAVLQWLHASAAIALVTVAAGHASVAVLHHVHGRRDLLRMWRGSPPAC